MTSIFFIDLFYSLDKKHVLNRKRKKRKKKKKEKRRKIKTSLITNEWRKLETISDALDSGM